MRTDPIYKTIDIYVLKLDAIWRYLYSYDTVLIGFQKFYIYVLVLPINKK